MNNFNILRLCCLIQDRDAQDLKRTALSVIFETLYETDNAEMSADELFAATNEKFNTALEKDFFDNLLVKSNSFILTTTQSSPLVRLTPEKFDEIDKNVSEYSIDPHIEKFLEKRKLPLSKKEKIIEILFQSIYENIYTFTPDKIETLIPQNISEKLEQSDLDIFNDFLEYDNHEKNRCLYNHFAKAIEFAILTSGKGVTQFSENIYKDKSYLLDTNIIFRLIGVGGEERRLTTEQLMKDCINQGIQFEYSHHTLLELNKKLEQCVIEISRAEKSNKIALVENVLENNPHLFNDDFITQYCNLRIAKIVNSPEQYEIEMKSRFKILCTELNIQKTNHKISIEASRGNSYGLFLMKKRKEINEHYRYSIHQAKVDANNILYVRERRGGNNYNYADVKSFYLTTDRGLNRILSAEKENLVPETILPSQLFIIHNPISSNGDKEPDYKTFFRFLKRRTSEFKLRGKDVLHYITQARMFSTDEKVIKSVIETYSDQRYKYSISDSVEEGTLLSFKDFSATFFDKKNAELKDTKQNYDIILSESEKEFSTVISKSKNVVKIIDFFLTLIVIPGIALTLKFVTKLDSSYIVIFLLIAEAIKFIVSSRTNFLKNIWLSLAKYFAQKTSYYKLSKNRDFLNRIEDKINGSSDNIWK
ncbi:MAG TPA: hypothetical protein VFS71_09510 [Flavobacterium sp.]|uniref:hypothetical protein n=1 Tax=Flavobacterium sp. TaxID=239 RepID=UPI002DBF1FDA|nr:hypothetical protein [Flavobacterium sp.]HEU4789911.1 hypothetical protein [Flavobacterium sp.]